MNRTLKSYILILALSLFISSCAGVVVETDNASLQNAQVTLNAFSLGSDFPTDIKIPDINGLSSTAFVVSDNPALGVIPIDLDTLLFSQKFVGLDATPLANIVLFSKKLVILSATQAFYLGGGGVVYFNPTTGAVFQTVNLTTPIQLNQSLTYSRPGDCNFDSVVENSVGPGAFSPNSAADIAVLNNRVFVTMSNLCLDTSFSSFYIQGVLLVFDLHTQPPFLTPAATPFVVLNGFNTTGITVANSKLVVTNTGDTELVDGGSVPETPSLLDEVDPSTLQITRSLNLGKVAANFGSMAVTEDGAIGFLGSSSFSEVYEIDLNNLTALRGEANPIVIFDSASDFITDEKLSADEKILFVSSFNNMAVKAVDVPSLDVLPTVLNFSFPGNPGVSGAGPMAVRPGEPGVDFNGPDLFVLTGKPGTLSKAKTY